MLIFFPEIKFSAFTVAFFFFSSLLNCRRAECLVRVPEGKKITLNLVFLSQEEI